MTREEARYLLMNISAYDIDSTRGLQKQEALEMAIEALKADVPDTNVGKWIYSYSNMTCPICNASFDDEIIYMSDNGKMNFCPNCGAKMEVEE